MIVRMVEAKSKPGKAAELAELVTAALARLTAVDGCLGFEVLRSYDEPDSRLLVVVRWRDAAAIEAVLGPEWATTLVPIPGEEQLLAREPHLYHFTAG